MQHGNFDQRERPLGELLRDLSHETATLVRQEVTLARVEIEAKLKAAGSALPPIGAAALLALGAFGALTAFLIALVAVAVPVWAAALIITIIYGMVAFVLVKNAQTKLKAALPPIPEQTAQTLKEDIAWAKTRTRSGAK